MNFISAKPTIGELQQKAAQCEKQADAEQEPRATELRDEAQLYRAWITELRSGRWTAVHDGR
jgi:hypothetical protein